MKEEKQLPCVEPGSVFIEEALFQRIIKMMPTNVFFKDRRARYRFVSNQCQTGFFQSAGDSVIGKTDLDLFDDPEVGVHLYREDLFVMESRIGKREMMDISLGGKTGYFDIRKNPVIDEDGKVLGISGVIHDLTKLREIERELYRQGILDALTGLYNRNHYRSASRQFLRKKTFPYP
jgi:PAS domain S-box-containing protein